MKRVMVRLLFLAGLSVVATACGAGEPLLAVDDVVVVEVQGATEEINLLRNDVLASNDVFVGLVGSTPTDISIVVTNDGLAEITSSGGTPGDSITVQYEIEQSNTGRTSIATLEVQLAGGLPPCAGQVSDDPDCPPDEPEETEAMLVVSIEDHDFEKVRVGDTTGVTVQVRLEDAAADESRDLAIALDGSAAASGFAMGQGCADATSERCDIQLSFSPTTAGEARAMLTVETSGIAGSANVALIGTGVLPSFNLSSNRAPFGTVLVDSPPPSQGITIENNGMLAIRPGIDGLPAGTSSTIANCGEIAPGASCSFSIEMSTATARSINATANVIVDGAGSMPIAISGSVNEPEPPPQVASITLRPDGNKLSRENPELSIEVQNNGTKDLEWLRTPTDQFIDFDAIGCMPLAVNETCTVVASASAEVLATGAFGPLETFTIEASDIPIEFENPLTMFTMANFEIALAITEPDPAPVVEIEAEIDNATLTRGNDTATVFVFNVGDEEILWFGFPQSTREFLFEPNGSCLPLQPGDVCEIGVEASPDAVEVDNFRLEETFTVIAANTVDGPGDPASVTGQDTFTVEVSTVVVVG